MVNGDEISAPTLTLDGQNNRNGSEILVNQAADFSPASDLHRKLSPPISSGSKFRLKPLPSSKVTQRHPRPISATPAERAATFPITDRLESSEQEETRLQDETRRNQLRILAHKTELESMHVERELFAARAELASQKAASPCGSTSLYAPSRAPSPPCGSPSPAQSYEKDNGMHELFHRLLIRDTEQAAREAAARDEAAARAEAREERLMRLMTRAIDSGGRSPASFVANKALVAYPSFSGENGQDIHAYVLRFEMQAGHLNVLGSNLTRELCLKLVGNAQDVYSRAFGHRSTSDYPTLQEVVAELSKSFSTPYLGGAKFHSYMACQRTPGSSGKDAILEVDSAFQAMIEHGIPATISEAETRYYVLQGMLRPSEETAFFTALSGDSACSDQALDKLRAGPGPEGENSIRRQSAIAENNNAREALFKLRVAKIHAFLVRSPATGNQAGVPQRARVAVAIAESYQRPAMLQTTLAKTGGATPRDDQERTPDECSLLLAYADRLSAGLGKKGIATTPPPEYFGRNGQHRVDNQREFIKRREHNACFACRQDVVDYGVRHIDCPRHGRTATVAQRAADRVPGADLPGPRLDK